MTEKEKWNTFYETVGGEYICEECGTILTRSQYKAASETSAQSWFIIILLSILLTPLFAVIHLACFGFKKKCPVCRAKADKMFPLNKPKGMSIFKSKHPEFAHLTDNLSIDKE